MIFHVPGYRMRYERWRVGRKDIVRRMKDRKL